MQTKLQPAASAGPALRVIIADGKFHGVMAATTPTGWRKHDDALVGLVAGNDIAVQPFGLFGEPLDERGRVGDLALGLGERFALLGRHEHREIILMLQ